LIAPRSRRARLLALIFIVGTLYSLAMAARPERHFLSRPFIEDAFYSLSASRSLGQGGGLSIDGVTPTNGVQPLICFLYAPAFALAGDDPFPALRIAVALQAALAALTALAVAWFVVTLLRRDADDDIARDLFWLVAATISVSYSLLVYLQNGLETSLAAAFVFASMAFYVERIWRRPGAGLAEFARLGALLGLGVLARIDIAILAAILAGWHALAVRSDGRRTSAVAGAATIGIVSFLVSLPWWLYNLIGFGHLMPTSGLAQKDLMTNRLESLDLVVRGVSNALLLVLHVPGEINGIVAYTGFVLAAALAITVAVVPALRRRVALAARRFGEHLTLAPVAPLVLFLAALVVYYTFFFGAPHFIGRYLTSLWLLINAGVLTFLYFLWREATRVGRTVLVSLGAAALAASVIAQSRNFTPDGLYSNAMVYPAEWIARNTTARDRVGMFQSGTTGFLFQRVTNLDGKVNPEALEALRTGRTAALVDSIGFEYIIDLDFYTRHIFHDPVVRARYAPIDTLPFGFVVWQRQR
jgi:hypothetical protein